MFVKKLDEFPTVKTLGFIDSWSGVHKFIFLFLSLFLNQIGLRP